MDRCTDSPYFLYTIFSSRSSIIPYMSDIFNEILHPTVVEPVLDNFVSGSKLHTHFELTTLRSRRTQRETSTDLGRLRLFQFGCPGAGFDFDYIPPFDYKPENCAGDADICEEAHHVASLTGRFPPTDSEKSLSSSLDASSSSEFFWPAGHFESSNGTSHYGSSIKQDLLMCDQDEAMGVDETNIVEEGIQPTTTDQWMHATHNEAGPSGPFPTLGQSAQAPSVRHLFPLSHPR